MKTYILLNPLSSLNVFPLSERSKRGLPTKDFIIKLTERGERIIIVDSEINRKVAKSVLNERPEFQTLSEIKELSQLNYRLILISESPEGWTWNIEGKDIRNSEDEIIYVDYSLLPNLPEDINDELLVMYLSGDYKWKNRYYGRNLDYESILYLKTGATPYFDWQASPEYSWIDLNRKMYSMLCRCVAYYMENKFMDELPDLPIDILQSNIICAKENLSYPLNLNHPALEGFVYTYDIMPPPPDSKYAKNWTEDKFAYVSTGINPSYLMRSSSQYRQVFSSTLKRVLTYMLEKGGVIFDSEDPESWKDVADKL